MTHLPTQVARAILWFSVLFCAVNGLPAHAQSTDQVADLAARVNRERVTRGLAPLALNAKLTAAAQAHAEDVARTGRTSSAQEGHIGSDGSTVFDRVARVGYGAYSWGRRLGENWAWYHSVADAMAMWMNSAPHRANILHQLYREMGIGVAPVTTGGFVYVIDFGSQPNILPVFINDGASETKTLDVKITLTSEEVSPGGDGENIGRPAEVMISNVADFAGAKWWPFAPTMDWTLAPNGGTRTVYVKYRDAKGRTATASDSIVFGLATPLTFTPTRATPRPAGTSVPPTETPPEIPSTAPTVGATEIAATELPTATGAPPHAASSDAGEANVGGLGVLVFVVMSVVLLRVWYAANR